MNAHGRQEHDELGHPVRWDLNLDQARHHRARVLQRCDLDLRDLVGALPRGDRERRGQRIRRGHRERIVHEGTAPRPVGPLLPNRQVHGVEIRRGCHVGRDDELEAPRLLLFAPARNDDGERHQKHGRHGSAQRAHAAPSRLGWALRAWGFHARATIRMRGSPSVAHDAGQRSNRHAHPACVPLAV
jgi:hypothetical protein